MPLTFKLAWPLAGNCIWCGHPAADHEFIVCVVRLYVSPADSGKTITLPFDGRVACAHPADCRCNSIFQIQVDRKFVTPGMRSGSFIRRRTLP